MCGNTLFLSTPALSASFFISDHILLRLSGLPFLLMKTEPFSMPCSRTYFLSILQSCLGSITVRIFPLQLIFARPSFTVSAVMNRSSETRMPVEHIVCIRRYSRSFFLLFAALRSLSYSASMSSLSLSANICFWIFNVFTRQSCQPR